MKLILLCLTTLVTLYAQAQESNALTRHGVGFDMSCLFKLFFLCLVVGAVVYLLRRDNNRRRINESGNAKKLP